MKRELFIFYLFLSLSAYSQDQWNTIKKIGEDVYISSAIDEGHEINYWFKKCMANDLFTFYRVSIVSRSEAIMRDNPGNHCGADSHGGTVVNEAVSDNIGPFDIHKGGWCGGNHLFSDGKTRTAETFSVHCYADGQSLSSDTVLRARAITIEVQNHIFNPLSATITGRQTRFTDTLCIEKVVYSINGNSIQVDLSHQYTNTIPVTVAKYYGMQSMFKDEKQLLTPSGQYTSWTDISRVGRFKKKDFPLFNRYIERNDFCFQSSYLSNHGLGTHSELADEDVIFIGNSWTKCYHKLIGNARRVNGDRDSWSGVYTWITTPLLHTASAFAYDGFIDGKKALFFSNSTKGDFTLSLPEDLKSQEIDIIENTAGAEIKNSHRSIRFSCPSSGSVIISLIE